MLSWKEVLSHGALRITWILSFSILLLCAPDTYGASLHRFVVRADIPGWQGPVCWAARGQTIRVRAEGRWTIDVGGKPPVGPAGYQHQPPYGRFRFGALIMQIGCQTDDLSAKEAPKRPPVVFERHAVGTKSVITPRYGGLVYFYINDSDCTDNAGAIQVIVEGGTGAAVIGYRSRWLRNWPNSIRNIQAPWGEFQGDHVIFSLPTKEMCKVKDPVKVMKYWDTIYLHYCDLDGRVPARKKTRYVPDVDISVGFMHSGYPIMYMTSTIPQLVDMDNPRFPRWGFLHELGHNFQRPAYNFEGTTEVTCNIFTLYGYQQMGLNKIVQEKWKDGYFKKLAYLANGADFAQWQKDPFLGLYMYME
ncbi:MAG: M60 family metallopeptidase, partial [Planctomycetes bacterium]|nr:M60 family metallopeptidase [Planctomycetota bacterium]